MLTCLWLVVASLIIFLVYNVGIIIKFGVPHSLSQSYYLLQDTKKGLGAFFSIMMFSMAGLLLPAWLELGEVVSSWSSYFNIFAFVTVAGLCFVAAAPAFRSAGLEPRVHDIAAKTAAAASLIWCLGVCWQIMYVPIVAMVIVALIAWLSKTWKSGRDYWLEMLCFGATYATLITELLIQIAH